MSYWFLAECQVDRLHDRLHVRSQSACNLRSWQSGTSARNKAIQYKSTGVTRHAPAQRTQHRPSATRSTCSATSQSRQKQKARQACVTTRSSPSKQSSPSLVRRAPGSCLLHFRRCRDEDRCATRHTTPHGVLSVHTTVRILHTHTRTHTHTHTHRCTKVSYRQMVHRHVYSACLGVLVHSALTGCTGRKRGRAKHVCVSVCVCLVAYPEVLRVHLWPKVAGWQVSPHCHPSVTNVVLLTKQLQTPAVTTQRHPTFCVILCQISRTP